MLRPGSAWIPRLRLGLRELGLDIFWSQALGRNPAGLRLGLEPEPRPTKDLVKKEIL